MSGHAIAQDASDETDEVIEIAEVEEQTEARQEKIIVTGSLLARDEFSSASPIQVITAEVATLEGLVDTASLLQGSSLASGSTQLNNTFQSFVTNGGVGTQTIDLRGCGDTRTLVLIDGKRPGPSGTRGAVSALDLNVVPQSIISRVEVLKDGASTIYGSDAVCGVVNIITRDSVDQFELNGTVTKPFDTGGEQYNISAAWGFELGDNADFTLSAEYRLAEELDTSERSYLDCQRDYVRDPSTGAFIDRLNRSATATDPRDNCSNLYHNTVLDIFGGGGRLVPNPDGSETIPTPLGTTIPGYRPRVGTGFDTQGRPFYEDILDSPILDNQDFFPRNENFSFFGTADVVLGGISWDSELLYSKRKTDVEGWRQFFPIVGSATNVAGNNPAFGYISDPTYSNSSGNISRPVLPYRSNNQIEVDFFSGSTSFSGGYGANFLEGWSWKVDGTYSRGEGTYTTNQILVSKSGDWNLDGVADYTGDGVADTVAPPAVDFFDIGFLDGSRVDELQAAIGQDETGETIYEQTTFTAVTSGEAFNLPAGAVGLGVGVEYREFSIDDTPGELTQVGNVWGRSTAGPTRGENSVIEAFAEVEVPIFKGQPFAEDVRFNGSVRTFEYDLGGSDTIYKAGLNWQVNPTVRARSSFGTSYRAPALFELFLQDQTAFVGQLAVDPCIDWGTSTNQNIRTNCAAAGVPSDFAGGASSALITTSGGGDLLESEQGQTFTAGLVFTPTFADLNIAIDYYEIELEDQITTLTGAQIVGGCYATTTFPNSFCDLFERAPATDTVAPFSIDNIQARTLNVDSQQQRGIDLEVRYEKDLNIGTLTVDTSINWALERYIDVFGSDFITGVADNDFNGTIGYPNVVGDANIRLDRGAWTYSWFTNFIGRQDDNRYFAADYNEPSTYNGLPAIYTVNTEAQFEHGLSVRWEGDTTSIAVGVRNIFDEHPPQVSDLITTSAGNTPLSATGYDLRGRRAFVTVSKNF